MGDQPPSVLQSESEFDRLFELSLDLFCIAGFDGFFKRVNPAFERTLGYSNEELLSRPFLDLVHPDDLQASSEVVAELERGEDLLGFVNRVICADGSVRWLEWNTRTMPGEGFVYGIARDVTDRRQAEGDLRDAQRMIEASRDEFRVLADEQAALRRVGTLVATRVAPEDAFAAVAEEVGHIVQVPLVSIVRYEADGSATELASFSERGAVFPVGMRWSLEGTNVVAQVRESGRPARIDDYAGLAGMIAETARRAGIRSTVGIPIFVAGRLWGAMVVSSTVAEPLPEGTEARLAGFTELAATAISNAESQAALGRLADEQAALRRVATLVARGVPPEELFAAVTEEVGQLLPVTNAALHRYDPDGMFTTVAAWATGAVAFPVGERWIPEGKNVTTMVFETGRPARVDDFTHGSGPIGIAAREAGYRSGAGTPVIVDGRLWGTMTVASAAEEPLPPDTEERLASFTELVATAIANAESREALGRLADEQTTLRRMAMLVAQGVPPGEIFSAVSEEVGRLIGSDTAAVVRFEHDPPAIVVVGVGKSIPGIPIGTRSELDDSLASTKVYRTGRSARVDARDWAVAIGPLLEPGRRLGLSSTVASPITVEGRLWGTLSISAKEPMPLDAEERLERFSELVATAIANAESRAELTASRARIVAASDQARRRIERDLHDGAQQGIVSLVLELRVAARRDASELEELRSDLSRIADDLTVVLDDLREISRGIHPAILAKGGLGPALKTLARRAPIPVEVHDDVEERLPESVEVAAYYVASEALTNATRHAEASVVRITLEQQDGRFELSVRDDGVGGADSTKGSGLIGLHDRVEALGGSIDISSPAGRGTNVVVQLPTEPRRGHDAARDGESV